MGERVPPYSALHKNPRFLNADIRKVQSRGNARAHVFKVRLISPAIVTKMRGAEAISAAASSASRCSETRGSVRFELAAHAKRKFNKKRGRAGGPNFEPEHPLARSDILHCLNVYYGRIAAGGAPRHRTGGIARHNFQKPRTFCRSGMFHKSTNSYWYSMCQAYYLS